jgi:hypothetical protein
VRKYVVVAVLVVAAVLPGFVLTPLPASVAPAGHTTPGVVCPVGVVCDLSSPLPGGERLVMELTALPTELGVLCGDGATGWYRAELSVRRVAVDGTERARASAVGCVPPGPDPLAGRLGALLPNLVWAATSPR